MRAYRAQYGLPQPKDNALDWIYVLAYKPALGSSQMLAHGLAYMPPPPIDPSLRAMATCLANRREPGRFAAFSEDIGPWPLGSAKLVGPIEAMAPVGHANCSEPIRFATVSST